MPSPPRELVAFNVELERWLRDTEAEDVRNLTAVFAAFVPLAAALYLTVTVVWTLVQRVILRRRYPLPQPAVVRA